MSTLKFLNYFLCSNSSYIQYRFACPKNHSFISSQLRLLSSATSSISYMELVKEVASKGPESQKNVAIRADEKSYSYLQLISSARKISNLLSKLDLKTDKGIKENEHHNGARVGIVAKPSAEFVAGILGTWLSGGCAVPLALSYPESELLHVMNDSDISIILSTEDHQELMNTIAAKTGAQLSLIPSIPDVHSSTKHDQSKDMVSEGQQDLLEINSYSENPAFILYTSGTTGKPKGVVHTHNGVLAQVQMLANAWEYTPKDQFLHCLPLHHVHGLFNALLAPLYAGSTVDFVPKFSVRGIWQRWRESYPTDGTIMDNAITVFTGVPTMYARLIQGYEAMDPELKTASASAARHLRLMMSGSSALPLPVMQQWETITGHRLLERYGMTEFVMAISNPISGKRKGGTVGKPFAGVQAKILLDDESSNDKTGVGELCIKSPSLFKEYWKLPEITKQSFTEDGYFKTGDTVTVDEDGYYIILGRTNADIMKFGGYKLSALEIEAVLLEHQAISECCVLGLPDKDYGEVVCAIVVPEAEVKRRRDEELKPALTLHELSDWAKEKLAPYKIPTRLFLWESLPRNAMGKVNKKELKRKLAEDLR
ncbi:probable CoA ligase CCL8 isoform X2 [Solanum stenotomum]|uniref:probable CoA ligase CCL8 isoform X1 n=1 Tax=Solanum stenotomum TaxID=172797 RepID=UPI0020D0B680|nr:probable CoA ligase CCL8 isoform X1 [Solanum stenotomum]XP_049397935.1 probable CoA ligase CCL8 isoform X2 [Solanum stenotomum]